LNGLALTMLVIAAVFWCAQRLSRNLWASVLLTAFGCYSFLYMLMPRPVFFSMVLFAVLITFLLESQRAGQVRLLYWLPLLFCLWANLHIQFVYGLFVFGLFVFGRSVQQLSESRFGRLSFLESPPALPLVRLWTIFGACLIAGCIGPYGPKLYQVVWEYSRAKYPYSMIQELLAPSFDAVSYYVELFLAAAAFFALGWRKRIDLFKTILLAIAVVSAFRTERDAWFLSMLSVAFLADAVRKEEEGSSPTAFQFHELGIVVATVCFALFLVATNADFNTRGLDRTAAAYYPINATNFIRKNLLPGPMFNSFDWGGFLTWYMPQYPVSIDGRNDLYGDEWDRRLDQVEGGEAPYEKEPVFADAQLILLQNHAPLAQLLSTDPAYQAVYRDDIAVVYVRRQAPGATGGFTQ
jgi:hypothetical protein